jgi:hypothetical protein
MRHILAVLTLGVVLATAVPAAFAYGDNVEYPGVGLSQNAAVTGIQPQVTDSFVVAGSVETTPYWVELRDQNMGR